MRTKSSRTLGGAVASLLVLAACAGSAPLAGQEQKAPTGETTSTTLAAADATAVDAPAGGTAAGEPKRSVSTAATTRRADGAASGAPIRIATVGTLSGVGAAQAGTAVAVQAWAKAINDSGGLRGHRVEVDVVDDGGDAARFRAALQDEVENRHVIAFVGNLTAFSLSQGAVDYLEKVGVPMVGGDRINQLWNQSPMLFPQASAGLAAIWIHALNTRRVGGKGAKLALLSCTEAQQCADADANMESFARELEIDLVYKAKASLLQPDFTTECIRARQAGAEYFILGLDPNANRRVAQDCHEQNWHPRFSVPQTAAAMATEPGLQSAYFASATFPWVSSATPAMAEFHRVMNRYAPQLELSGHASSGWVSAKLFERAAQGIGDTPKSAQILEGLWGISNDTLGGLTAPLTFVRGKPAPAVYCFFGMEVRSRSWVATSTTPDCQARRA